MSTYATVQHNEVIVREQHEVTAKKVVVQQKPALVRVSARQLERQREQERAREQQRAREQARERELERERELRNRPVIVQHPVVIQPAVNVGTYTTNYTYAPQPFAIATHVSLSQRLDVDTTGKLAGLSTLELDAVGSGSTAISQITVYYTSGAYQLYNLNTVVGAQNPTLRLMLGDGTDVARVIIDGHSSWDGGLNVSVRC